MLVPEKNKKDVEEIESEIKSGLSIHFVENMEDALPYVNQKENRL